MTEPSAARKVGKLPNGLPSATGVVQYGRKVLLDVGQPFLPVRRSEFGLTGGIESRGHIVRLHPRAVVDAGGRRGVAGNEKRNNEPGQKRHGQFSG